MKKHLWWVVCFAGMTTMAAAMLGPISFAKFGWWQQLEQHLGGRPSLMLTGMSVGAGVVVVGLLLSLFGKRRVSGGILG